MRKSNIELLRIFLFIMVVAIHTCGPYLASNHLSGTFNWQVANIFDGASRVAVDCFVLITGYFMCTKNTKPSINIKKLLLPLLFYIFIYLPLFVRDFKTIDKSVFMLVKGLVTLDYYFYHLWYVFLTIIIYLLSPFLNIIIEKIDKILYKKLLIILFVLLSVIPTLMYMTDFYDLELIIFYSKASLFILLYLLGAYIKKFASSELNIKKLVFLFIVSEFLIVSLSALYNSRFSPMIFIKKLSNINISYPFGGFLGVFYEYNNILVIISSVFLLLIFLNLNIENKVINKISSLTYGAYLSHIFFINLVSYLLDPTDFQHSILYLPAVIGFILCVSLCSIVFEYIRQLFTGVIFKNKQKSDIITTVSLNKERDVL